MRLTKYSHACVRLERDGGVLVIDPGTLSEPESLDGADAVLITHEHFDHLDQEKLADALAKRPSVAVFTHPDVVKQLAELSGVVHEVVPGDEFEAAGFRVRAYGGLHAIIHPEIPRIPNVGFFVEGTGDEGGVYHPGDSFDVPTDARVDTLFVPVSAPWLKISDSIEFIRAVAPRRAYALHDKLYTDLALGIIGGALERLSGAEYARLEPGTSVDV
jgi:L-ascorbate metabolism protein UlaG (beta-lactamase superfamily)